MERLSALDAEFLHLEDGTTTLHIAGLAVFDGPVPADDELRELLAHKLHLIPRYRQRVRAVPLELGRPVWVDDPHFNLDYHIRRTALPAPGDEATLQRLMARLMAQPLDRNRPLWEVWLVEGLADDRWALIFKVHHCMVDGVAGVGLLTVLLDLERDVELPEIEPWEPEDEPSGASMVLGAWAGLAGDVTELVRRVPDLATHPASTVQTVLGTLEGVVRFGRNLSTTPPLSIEGTIGPHRRWSCVEASLDDVKTIRKNLGGTVNDVVLAVISRGYRDLLVHHGDVPDEALVRTGVPVSMRREDGQGRLDNRVSVLLLQLPVNIADPQERLLAVCREMQQLKQSHMAEAGEWVTHMGELAPPMVMGNLSRVLMRAMHQLPQRSVNTVTTNVPGPQFPLYCLGREMLEYRPYVPITQGVRVGTAILSYNGKLSFGVTADYDSVPDVDIVTQGIRDGIEELLALV